MDKKFSIRRTVLSTYALVERSQSNIIFVKFLINEICGKVYFSSERTTSRKTAEVGKWLRTFWEKYNHVTAKQLY